MAFMDLGTDLNNLPEQDSLPEGDYDLIIEGSKFNPEKNMTLVRLAVEGHPDAKVVFHNLSMPKQEDEPEKAVNKLKFLKLFLVKFKVPFTTEGFDDEDFAGKTARCHLVQEEYQGQVNNKIKL